MIKRLLGFLANCILLSEWILPYANYASVNWFKRWQDPKQILKVKVLEWGRRLWPKSTAISTTRHIWMLHTENTGNNLATVSHLKAILLYPFHRWGNRGSKRLDSMPRCHLSPQCYNVVMHQRINQLKNKENFTGFCLTHFWGNSVLLDFDIEPNKCEANVITGNKRCDPQVLFFSLHQLGTLSIWGIPSQPFSLGGLSANISHTVLYRTFQHV